MFIREHIQTKIAIFFHFGFKRLILDLEDLIISVFANAKIEE